MFECSITDSAYNREMLDFIYEELSQSAKKYDAVLTRYENQETSSILIACQAENKNFIMIQIKKAISSCAVKFYKKNFLKKNIKSSYKDLKMKIFEKALSFFDDDCDSKLIYEKTFVSEQINLSSFFEFCLTPLKNKWLSLCSVVSDNPVNLMSENNFLSLLEFLVENSPYKTDEIKIIFTDFETKLFLKDKEIKLSKNLIEQILELSPKKIIIDINSKNLIQKEKYLFKIYRSRICCSFRNTEEMPVIHAQNKI